MADPGVSGELRALRVFTTGWGDGADESMFIGGASSSSGKRPVGEPNRPGVRERSREAERVEWRWCVRGDPSLVGVPCLDGRFPPPRASSRSGGRYEDCDSSGCIVSEKHPIVAVKCHRSTKWSQMSQGNKYIEWTRDYTWTRTTTGSSVSYLGVYSGSASPFSSLSSQTPRRRLAYRITKNAATSMHTQKNWLRIGTTSCSICALCCFVFFLYNNVTSLVTV